MKLEVLQNQRSLVLKILVAAVLFFLAKANVRIINLVSPSLPYKFCVHLLKAKPQRGDLCVFQKRGSTIVKYLVGLEGDEVRNIDGQIFVGFQKVEAAKKTKLLTPIKSKVIPKGFAFVAGTHEDSLDSRYEEFGLVKLSDIQGKAVGF